MRGTSPLRVKAMMPVLPRSCARPAAARSSFTLGVSLSCSAESTRGSSRSVVVAMRVITSTQRMGCLPVVVSPESMTESAISSTALETSVTSARVGTGAWIIDSSMCVATMTGLRRAMAMATAWRWTSGRVS